MVNELKVEFVEYSLSLSSKVDKHEARLVEHILNSSCSLSPEFITHIFDLKLFGHGFRELVSHNLDSDFIIHSLLPELAEYGSNELVGHDHGILSSKDHAHDVKCVSYGFSSSLHELEFKPTAPNSSSKDHYMVN